jgi:precorrin-6y C5,15-methyltransferase (decarboxylating) CbiE subunit
LPKVYVVGVGPGSKDLVVPRALDVIHKVDLVVGWELDIAPVRQLCQSKTVYIQDVRNYRQIARQAAEDAKRNNSDVVVLRVGDPCMSSGLKGLLDIFDGFDVEIVPGISSIQLAAAISKIEMDNAVALSFHDYGSGESEKRFMLESYRAGKHIFMLIGPDFTPNKASEYLIKNGVDPRTRAVVYSNLTLENQRICESTLEDVSNGTFDWLSVFLVFNPAVRSAKEEYEEWLKNREPEKPVIH